MRIYVSILILFLTTVSAYAGDKSNTRWIGMVRYDGILAPLAVYQNGQWTSPWPSPDDDRISSDAVKDGGDVRNIPLEWSGGTKQIPEMWNVRNDETWKSIKLVKLMRFQDSCQTILGIKTDIPIDENDIDQKSKKHLKRKSQPKKQTRLAVTSTSDTHVFVAGDKDAVKTAELVKSLTSEFNDRETVAIERSAKEGHVEGNYLKYSWHPVSFAERNRSSFEINTISRADTTVKDCQLYYLEIRRNYRDTPRSKNTNDYGITQMNAWVAISGGTFKILGLVISLFELGDSKGLFSSRPYAVITLDGKDFVISEEIGYEGHEYSVSIVTDNKIQQILKIEAGGC